MLLSKRELPILIFSLIYISIFTAVAWRRNNEEFLLYVVVLLVFGGLVLVNQRSVQFPRLILWGLALWGFMHMAGGLIPVDNTVLYGVTLIPLVPKYGILRFDQVVHFFGFGVATLACHHLLKRYVTPDVKKGIGFWMLVTLMGCGLGAMNEIVEFIAVLSMPKTGVGGYENTLFDLVFNFLGALAATLFLQIQERKRRNQTTDHPRPTR